MKKVLLIEPGLLMVANFFGKTIFIRSTIFNFQPMTDYINYSILSTIAAEKPKKRYTKKEEEVKVHNFIIRLNTIYIVSNCV